MYNIHIRIYTYFCGTGSGRKLKAYINHVLRSAIHSVSLRLDSCQSAVYHLFLNLVSVMHGSRMRKEIIDPFLNFLNGV